MKDLTNELYNIIQNSEIKEGNDSDINAAIGGMDRATEQLDGRLKGYKQWRKKLDKVKRGEKIASGAFMMVDRKTLKRSQVVDQLRGRMFGMIRDLTMMIRYSYDIENRDVSFENIKKQIN